METKRTDRRIRYTKMILKDSFVKILRQKPISKITVKEICDDADINRATFYKYYYDQYDLLQQIENELTEGISHHLSQYNLKEKLDASAEMLENILEFIKQNADLFDLLLNFQGDIMFQQEVTQIIGQQHFTSLAINPKHSKEDEAYLFLFLANGCIGIIKKWLADNTTKPVPEIASLILKSSMGGMASFQ